MSSQRYSEDDRRRGSGGGDGGGGGGGGGGSGAGKKEKDGGKQPYYYEDVSESEDGGGRKGGKWRRGSYNPGFVGDRSPENRVNRVEDARGSSSRSAVPRRGDDPRSASPRQRAQERESRDVARHRDRDDPRRNENRSAFHPEAARDRYQDDELANRRGGSGSYVSPDTHRRDELLSPHTNTPQTPSRPQGRHSSSPTDRSGGIAVARRYASGTATDSAGTYSPSPVSANPGKDSNPAKGKGARPSKPSKKSIGTDRELRKAAKDAKEKKEQERLQRDREHKRKRHGQGLAGV